MAWDSAEPPVERIPNYPAPIPASGYTPIASAEAPGGDVYFFGRYYHSDNSINEVGYQKYSSGVWGSYVKVDGQPDLSYGAALGSDVNCFGMAINEDGKVLFVYGGTLGGAGNSALSAKLLDGGVLGARVTASGQYSTNGNYRFGVIARPGGLFTILMFRFDGGSRIALVDFDPTTSTFQNERTIVDLAATTDAFDNITDNAICFNPVDDSIHVVNGILRGHYSTTVSEIAHIVESSTGSISIEYISTGVVGVYGRTCQPQIACASRTGKIYILFQGYNGTFPAYETVSLIETDGVGVFGPPLLISDTNFSVSRIEGGRALVADADGNAHVIIQDQNLAADYARWYRKKTANGSLSVADEVFNGQSLGDYSWAYQFVILNTPDESSEGFLYAFCMRQGNFGTAPFATWWNKNPEALAAAPRTYGTCIDVHKLSSLSPTAYNVYLGEIGVFGGSAAVDGDTFVAASGAPGQLFVDTSYRISAAGRLKAWTVSQINAGLSYPVEIGTMFLVVLYKSGSNYIVRAVSPMTRNLPRVGQYEFSCDVSVVAGDFLGVWITNSPAVQVGANTELSSGTGLLLEFTAAALPVAGANLGAGPSGTLKVLSLFARGEVSNPTKIQIGRSSSGTAEDAFGYKDFVSGTDAFPDANIVSPANLFDADDTTVARSTSTVASYAYYYLNQSAGLVAVESLAFTQGAVGPTGTIEVHVSQNQQVAATLAGAQAIPSGEWKAVATFDNTLQALDHVVHVARRAKWVRLTLNSPSGLSRATAFEIKTAPTSVSGGNFVIHPTSGVKSRIWLDSASHRWAPQRTNTISVPISGGDRFLILTNDDSEFTSQFLVGDRVYVEDAALGRGLSSQRVFVGTFRQLVSPQIMELLNGHGQPTQFPAGSRVSPPPIAMQARAINAAGKTIGATPWIPTTGTYEQWLRKHDVFAAGA